MKTYLPYNVWDAAIKRINRLYDEFDDVIVTFSGGKDSTVCLELTLQVARERGKLPVDVVFIDQEAEWQTVIDYIRDTFSRDEINPKWLQVPIQIFNATSTIDPWLQCWEIGKDDEWIRAKEPNSIKVNDYGTKTFNEMFTAYGRKNHPNGVAIVGGVRCEESPARALGLTTYATYKDITWGSAGDKKQGIYTFYPIYDWSYTDVWRAIHVNKWPYCKVYDYMYNYGVPIMQMRVSNVHHETAVKTLFYLQEVEAETWEKICKRVSGINTAGQMQGDFYGVKKLPFMFNNWKEYRDHLCDNLVTDPEIRGRFKREFKAYDDRYMDEVQEELTHTQIACVLTNDYHRTKLSVFDASHGKFSKTSNHAHRADKGKKSITNKRNEKRGSKSNKS